MLNELLRDEELAKITFADLLNAHGCNTGIDTEKLLHDYIVKKAERDWERLTPEEAREYVINAVNEVEKRLDDNMNKEPDYYNENGLSPIGAFKQGLLSQEELIGFYKGNIIKYVIRAGKKDSAIKDLKKAKDYINFYMDIFTMTPEEQAELNQELISTTPNLEEKEDNDEIIIRPGDFNEDGTLKEDVKTKFNIIQNKRLLQDALESLDNIKDAEVE
jgi:hypothetical protein